MNEQDEMERAYQEEIKRFEMVLREDQSITRKEVADALQNMRDELKNDFRIKLAQGFQITRKTFLQMDTKINGIKIELREVQKKIGELATSQESSMQFTFRPFLKNQMCSNHGLPITNLCFTCQYALCCQKCIQMHQPRLLSSSKPQLSSILPILHNVRSLQESSYIAMQSVSKCKIKIQEGLKIFANLKQIISVRRIKLNKKKEISKKLLKEVFQEKLLLLGQNKNLFEAQHDQKKSLEEELLALEHQEMYLQIMDQIIVSENFYLEFSSQLGRVLHHKNYQTQKQKQIILCEFFSSTHQKINNILKNLSINQIKWQIENVEIQFESLNQNIHKKARKSYLKTEEDEDSHEKYSYIPPRFSKQTMWNERLPRKSSSNSMKKTSSKGIPTSFLNPQNSFRLRK